MRFWLNCGCLLLVCRVAAAQAPGGTELTGKIAGVETKGKVTSLTVKDDGGTEHVFDVTPKVAFELVSKGAEDCLAPGLFVQIDALQSNNAFFGSGFQVFPDQTGKLPPAKAIKPPRVPGASSERYVITGEIVRFEKVDDGKYDLLHLKQAAKSELSVYVERNRTIRVVQTDPQQAAVGQSVTVAGRLAGQKLLPNKITIDTGEKMTGADLLASRKKK